MKAELIKQQAAMQEEMKTDVQKLTNDMLGLVKNINGIHDELDSVTDHVSGLTSNMNILRTDVTRRVLAQREKNRIRGSNKL